MKPTRIRTGNADVRRSERGQILILFVVLFSVVLALAALSIDQGFWYGKRRVAQKDVDLAARSGAIAFLGDNYDACEQADETATQNGATLNAGGDGCDADGKCVTTRAQQQVSSLFARFFNIDGIDIGAESVACVGSAQGVHAFSGDNGPDGLPVVLAPGGDRDCFSGVTLRVGHECVIWGANDDGLHNRLLWWTAEATIEQGNCVGPVSGDPDEIEEGVEWACHDVGEDHEHELQTWVPDDSEQDDLLRAFRDRLQQPNGCTFVQTFAWGDGANADTGSPVTPPAPFPGGNNSHEEDIYVQRSQDFCLENPRLVMIPVTHESNNQDEKDVNGVAIVYLTGCYDFDSNISEPNPQSQTNRCSGGLGDDTEVRGVPLRVFLTEGAVGDLGEIDVLDYPLTIQTCRTVDACTQ